MRESVVENYFCARIKALGGDVRKVKWVGHNGAPDRLVMLPNRHPLVELKRPRAKPRINQLNEHDRLRSYGFEVLVIDTIELVDFYFPLN